MADPVSLAEHPTVTWEALNDGAVFYSKKHVYQMQWILSSAGGGSDLSGYIVAAAKFGGPVGERPREQKKLFVLY
jgi:vacuolar protein sorting-associated protein 16